MRYANGVDKVEAAKAITRERVNHSLGIGLPKVTSTGWLEGKGVKAVNRVERPDCHTEFPHNGRTQRHRF